MATTIENLPDHLLSDILVRVPARTLAQMRSVSKPLNALLSQPSFIQSHLHRSIETNHEILLVFKHLFSSQVTAHPSTSPHLELPDFIQLPVDEDPHDPYVGHQLIDAVNGLICFSYRLANCGRIIQIWNPSISALLELPQLVLSLECLNRYRFGFDPDNDDYKVVRLAFTAVDESDEDYGLVQVYSMRKRCWKLITKRFPAHLKIFGRDEVCGDGHDGHLHWLCYHHDDDDDYDYDQEDLKTIVAFDLGAETFREIALPVDNIIDRKIVLGVLGGKLCLMSCLKDDNCEVWLMNEYGNAESWAKHHVFSQFGANNMRPFGFTLSKEFLFTSSDVLSLYDPIAAKVKSFMFKVDPDDSKIVPYVDSLVWITPDKRKKKRKRCMVPSKN